MSATNPLQVVGHTQTEVFTADNGYQIERGPKGWAYLAGPMRNLEEFNFPAFHEAAAALIDNGWGVFNPAAYDVVGGFEPEGLAGTEDLNALGFNLRHALGSDLAWITQYADAVAVLPGWEDSKGAQAEVATARALGLMVFDAQTGVSLDAVPSSAVPLVDRKPGGEERVTSATGGQKGVKEARFDLIPPGPMWELAVLYGRGNVKYPPTEGELANWQRGYPWSLSYGALRRHLELWWMGEDHDEEMAVKHLTAVAWHAFNLAWFMENRPEFDDRPVKDQRYDGALPTPQWIIEKKAAE